MPSLSCEENIRIFRLKGGVKIVKVKKFSWEKRDLIFALAQKRNWFLQSWWGSCPVISCLLDIDDRCANLVVFQVIGDDWIFSIEFSELVELLMLRKKPTLLQPFSVPTTGVFNKMC